MMSANKKPDVAVILAAGYGKRLLPHTQDQPKPLLPVNGTPLIHRTFDALLQANIRNVIVVVGYLGNLLEDYISKSFSPDFETTFVRQDHMTGSADALALAANHLTDGNHGDLLVLACDYLLPKFYLRELIDFHLSGDHRISVSLRRINADKVGESNRVDFAPGHQILHIHEKPQNRPTGNQHTSASLIYVLPPQVFQFIHTAGISKRGERELPDVVNRMIVSGMTARGLVQEALLDWEKEYR